MIRSLTLAALTVVLVGQTARAQAPAGSGAVNDALFAEAAATSGMAEVMLSEIGLQRATDPELKRFSQQMIDDHSKVNQELTNLAAQKRVALPRMLDPRAQFCAQNLRGVPRQEFDRCYAKAQLTAHMDAVAMFEAEAQRGQDADMKALAARTLPHIKEHLQMIKPIAIRFEKEQRSDSSGTER